MRRFTWFIEGIFISLCAFLLYSAPVRAQYHRSDFYLLDFRSHELMDLRPDAELFTTTFMPHDFDMKEKTSHHRPWTLNIIRSATQSLFLNSGYGNFPGSNYNIPPTLKAYRNP